MRRPRRSTHRVDAKQAEVVKVLRSCGALVFPTTGVGGGFPDLLVRVHGRLFLIEVKSSQRDILNDEQREFARLWGTIRVENGHQALQAVGLIPR